MVYIFTYTSLFLSLFKMSRYLSLLLSAAAAASAGEYDSAGKPKGNHATDWQNPMSDIPNVESVLEKYLPEKELKQVKRILYGKGSKPLDVPATLQAKADNANFQISLQDMTQNARKEVMREPQVVRVGTLQSAIPMQPTDGDIKQQYDKIVERHEELINAAGELGIQVLGLQEAWTAPFFFATREKYPYAELAEDPKNGPSAKVISRLAKKWNMVIVSSILERDPVHQEKSGIPRLSSATTATTLASTGRTTSSCR